jgi:hypothetical protein
MSEVVRELQKRFLVLFGTPVSLDVMITSDCLKECYGFILLAVTAPFA